MADGQPFRISWVPVVNIDEKRLSARIESASKRPRVQRGVHKHPVAVVGGGPSLPKYLDELKAWPGEVWAINSMADWLAERGIASTLFTVDPDYLEAKTQRRLLATCCDPEMFTSETLAFDLLEHADDGITGGVSTASRAPALALRLGYPGATFFGCDSSFASETHVVHSDYDDVPMIVVKADGREFTTMPGFLMQAESLSLLMRTFPDYFVNRGDGLLPAMVADVDWTTVAVSAAMKELLIAANGDTGLYETPYEVSK